MYPVVLANDGTALHPAIQFDERMKQNMGLEFSVDLDYVNNNPFLLKETFNDVVFILIVFALTCFPGQCTSVKSGFQNPLGTMGFFNEKLHKRQAIIFRKSVSFY